MEHTERALRNAKEEIVAWVAYDFDLLNLVYPEFFKNKDADWDDESRLAVIAQAYGKPNVSELLRGMHAGREGILSAMATCPASFDRNPGFTRRVERFCSAAACQGLL